jgi:hypothetical protein
MLKSTTIIMWKTNYCVLNFFDWMLVLGHTVNAARPGGERQMPDIIVSIYPQVALN